MLTYMGTASSSINSPPSHLRTYKTIMLRRPRAGGFLVTLMGSPTGGSPGRIARYNAARQLVGEYPDPAKFPDAVTLPSFNPHGTRMTLGPDQE